MNSLADALEEAETKGHQTNAQEERGVDIAGSKLPCGRDRIRNDSNSTSEQRSNSDFSCAKNLPSNM